MDSSAPESQLDQIAMIGLACRFPGARNADEFWRNLRDGVESISFFSDQELLASGLEPAALRDSQHVRAGAVLEDIDLFDAGFFDISPRQAELTDPQHRLFLECAWEALENAGYDPAAYEGVIGMYAGTGLSNYLLFNLYPALGFTGVVANLQTLIGNDKDYLATHVSYKLNLRGPSVSVQTACSTSLVAVHMACQSLLNGECDMALAGGVTVRVPHKSGYFYQDGAIFSPDGHCRPFDASAQGTVFGNGMGIVVLKRLADAVADGDRIEAIIRGSAINNDGALKAGYTAPSEDGQAAVIAEALALAQVKPETIQYIEAHGTGTALGDPIEVAALTRVFRAKTAARGICALGAVKSNIGHLEAAAGIAGLIKTVLALKHKQLPPSLHFRSPNPQIDFASSPFYVNARLTDWPRGAAPRRAGVSAFGIGGTNAHVVLEEAPPIPARPIQESRQAYLLPLSARGPDALRDLVNTYRDSLMRDDGGALPLQDVVYTSSMRRRHHTHRLAVVGHTHQELAERLDAVLQDLQPAAGEAGGRRPAAGRQKVAFVFSGQGSQWAGMGRQLLDQEPVFREVIQQCDLMFRQVAGAKWSLMQELVAEEPQSRLDDTEIAQPVIFAVQIALAALWRSWGIKPAAVVGHSVGEVAAAHVAGVLTLADAVKVIYHRGRLMQRATGLGKMAAVPLPWQEIEQLLARHGYGDRLSVAAINSPTSTVLSGEPAALAEVLRMLQERGVSSRMLRVNYAFHSPQMAPFQAEMTQILQGLEPRPAALPIVSTVSGRISDERDFDAAYWGRNIREPVRLSDAVGQLLESGCETFVEVSPHPVLLPAIEEQLCSRPTPGAVVPSLRRGVEERATLLESLGALYSLGQPVDWGKLCPAGGRCVALPAYPWQRKRYWLEPSRGARPGPGDTIQSGFTQDRPDDWLYALQWQPKERGQVGQRQTHTPGHWLIFADRGGVGAALGALLEEQGEACTLAFAGQTCQMADDGTWSIDPTQPEDVERLLAGASHRGIVHLWGLDATPTAQTTAESLQRDQENICGSVLHLVQAIARSGDAASPRLWLVTRGAQPVGAQPARLAVAQAPLWGMGRVIALEHPDLHCVRLDLDLDGDAREAQALLEELIAAFDTDAPNQEDQVAFRQGARYVARLAQAADIEPQVTDHSLICSDGTYLITGGLGGLGLLVARWMVEDGARHLALVGRSGASESACAAVRELEQAGAHVLLAQADVACEEHLARVLADIAASGQPLRGIVHAAGVLDDGILLRQDWGRFAGVLAAKVEGAWNLHTLTRNMPLDFFVLFSSTAALLGSPGQGNYAAANAFLDGLAHERRALGLPAVSINWGGWATVGMAARRGAPMPGIGAIAPQQGLQAFERALRRKAVQLAVLPADWPKLLSQFARGAEPPVLTDLAQQARVDGASQPLEDSSRLELLRHMEETPPQNRRAFLVTYMREQASKVLGLDPALALDPQQPLHELGLDSLMAIELRNALNKAVGRSLPATLLFNYPTIEGLATYLAQEVFHLSEDAAPARSRSPDDAPDQLLTDIQHLSADEVEALLAEELAAVEVLVGGK